MATARDVHGAVFKDGTGVCLARVEGYDGVDLVQADVSAAEYSIYLLDEQKPDSRAAVAGHQAESLVVSEVIFNTLQTGGLWTEDTTGYNFCLIVDVSSNPAFAVAGKDYLVEVKLTPVSGQVILLRFRGRCI